MRIAVIVWVVGLLSAVPYATYRLLFEAPREQYAALITFVLFWIFGYWSLVGPILTAAKVRRVLRAIERARSRAELVAILGDPETKSAAIDLIASENGIPRFVAAWVYRILASRLPTEAAVIERQAPLS
jgi:hypothetical protein